MSALRQEVAFLADHGCPNVGHGDVHDVLMSTKQQDVGRTQTGLLPAFYIKASVPVTFLVDQEARLCPTVSREKDSFSDYDKLLTFK
jgi:hypothetical protein